MSLDRYLRIAAERTDLDGLTLWRTRNGQWQANTRFGKSDGFTVIAGGDPIMALKAALVSGSKQRDLFPDYVGFGEDGPVGIEMKRLIEALARNLRARGEVL